MQQDVGTSMQFLHGLLAKAGELLVSYGFDVLGALVILLVGFKCSQWVANFTLNFLEKKRVDLTIARFVAGTAKGLVIGFAVIVALGKFGITIAPIIAGIGALAFGGTFAIQGVLSNMGAGVSLLLFRPFTVGDTIQVAGVSGVVEVVKLACTVLTDQDGVRIVVPNKHIVGEVLHNSYGYRLVDSVVGISYGDDPECAIGVLKEVVQQFPEVATAPAPIIGIQAFGDSSINLGVRYWVPTKQYFNLSYAVNLAIFKALKDASITIPFPQRDVHLTSTTAS